MAVAQLPPHKGALKGVLHHLGRLLLWILPELGEIAIAVAQAGLILNPEAQLVVTVIARLAIKAGPNCPAGTPECAGTPACKCLTNPAVM